MFLIWWLSQEACEQIDSMGGPLDTWPAYIATEFRSRMGRAGRGRLWVAGEIPLKQISWLFDHPVADIADRCGGIVIRQEDAWHIIAWPGFLTTPEFSIYEPPDA